MNLAAEQPGLTDDQITAYIADPATIPTHEVALEVSECLDNEIAAIQTQIDAAMIEANIRPLSEDRQGWVRRASYAAAMKRNQRHKVYQRDKELRGMKGRAFTEPKHSKEEKVIKQQRLLVEAETRRAAKRLLVDQLRVREMEAAQQRREMSFRRDEIWNQAIAHAANIAEHLNGWGNTPCPELAEHIAKNIREAARGGTPALLLQHQPTEVD